VRAQEGQSKRRPRGRRFRLPLLRSLSLAALRGRAQEGQLEESQGVPLALFLVFRGVVPENLHENPSHPLLALAVDAAQTQVH